MPYKDETPRIQLGHKQTDSNETKRFLTKSDLSSVAQT